MGFDLYIHRGDPAADVVEPIADREVFQLAARDEEWNWELIDGGRALVWGKPGGPRWPVWWADGYLYCGPSDSAMLGRLQRLATRLDAGLYDEDGRAVEARAAPAQAEKVAPKGGRASGRAAPDSWTFAEEVAREQAGDEAESDWAAAVERDQRKGLWGSVAGLWSIAGISWFTVSPPFGLVFAWLGGLMAWLGFVVEAGGWLLRGGRVRRRRRWVGAALGFLVVGGLAWTVWVVRLAIRLVSGG